MMTPENIATVIVGVLSSGGLVGLYTQWRQARTQDKESLRKSISEARVGQATVIQQFESNLMAELQRNRDEADRVAQRHRDDMVRVNEELRQCRLDHKEEIERRITLIERLANMEGQIKAMPMIPVSLSPAQVQVTSQPAEIAPG